MKYIYSLLFCCLLSSLTFAHSIDHSTTILHRWRIEKENTFLNGSFYMMKDGKVFIEDAQHHIHSIGLNQLAKEDQEFALLKARKIQLLNTAHSSNTSESRPFFTIGFGLSFLILVVIFYFTFFIVTAQKRKFLYPMLAVGGIFFLSAFTKKVTQLLETNTDPSSLDAAFAPFIPQVHTSYDANYYYVESRGIPTTHTMMAGISSHGWQQQVPIPQCYIGSNAWSIPLNPVISDAPIPVDSIHFTRGAIALAVNGVPIFNVHTNTGVDSYIDGQLDSYGGHCGRADDYHYHIAPLHLYEHTSTSLPVAYGLDGYAVYGNVEPDGSSMQPLDQNHGHFGNDGVYHYHGTTSAPYMIAKMAGVVTEDATHQLIPQAAAHPVRPSLTPLNGALITDCIPNATQNGYTIVYSRNNQVDSVSYNWNTTGAYTFRFYTNGNLDSTRTYNGFSQCSVPGTITGMNAAKDGIQFSLFPNPGKHFIQLQLNNALQEKAIEHMHIYSMKGDVVYSSQGFHSVVSIESLPKGTYLLVLSGKQQSPISKRFIIE